MPDLTTLIHPAPLLVYAGILFGAWLGRRFALPRRFVQSGAFESEKKTPARCTFTMTVNGVKIDDAPETEEWVDINDLYGESDEQIRGYTEGVTNAARIASAPKPPDLSDARVIHNGVYRTRMHKLTPEQRESPSCDKDGELVSDPMKPGRTERALQKAVTLPAVVVVLSTILAAGAIGTLIGCAVLSLIP